MTALLTRSRAVLSVAGADTLRFLNGLLAQDVAPLALAGAKPVYSAVLDARGRLAHDIFVHATSDNSVFVDCDRTHADSLLKEWTRRRLRMKLTIEDASDDVSVVARLPEGGDEDVSGDLPDDPRRIPELGRRGIVQNSSIVSADDHSDDVMARQYMLRRWELGVAEGGEEMQYGTSLPLEMNVAGLNGVSFTKGCYIGQELTARTHFRGVVRKRIMPFELLGEKGLPLAVGTTLRRAGEAVQSTRRSRSDGEIFAYDAEAKRGLALVRLKSVADGTNLEPFDKDQDVESAVGLCELRVTRPSWWPAEWGREDEEEPRWS